MQGELEASLEKLNDLIEEDWSAYIDSDSSSGKYIMCKLLIAYHLGERFFKYKQEVNLMRETVERQFSTVINQIEADFPDVKDEEVKDGP